MEFDQHRSYMVTASCLRNHSVYGWLMVGTLLGDGRHNVGLWLVIVGAMLGDSWRLVGS